MDFFGVQKKVMAMLDDGLSNKLYYHSINHTADVVRVSGLLAVAEGLAENQITIVHTAALFHDTGFLDKYEKNEEAGCNAAEKILPLFGYAKEDIASICEIIMATRIPQNPKNILGKIICDADLDYLGTYCFHSGSILLRRELEEHGKNFSDMDWLRLQIDFMDKHHYWTKTSMILRDAQKKLFVKELQGRLTT